MVPIASTVDTTLTVTYQSKRKVSTANVINFGELFSFTSGNNFLCVSSSICINFYIIAIRTIFNSATKTVHNKLAVDHHEEGESK